MTLYRMSERCKNVKNKKRTWLQVIAISTCFVYLLEMQSSYAAEDGQATVSFYKTEKKEQRDTKVFPYTGENASNKMIVLSGISILLIITGMISYRILTNEERI